MCMKQHQVLALAYGSLMALIFAGTYVLEDDSWMAYLLLLPGFLIFKAMDAPAAGSDRSRGSRKASEDSTHSKGAMRMRGLGRGFRIGLALGALTIPAALLMRAFDLNDPIMYLVLIPILLLSSLVDREYFGWSVPSDRAEHRPTA